MATRPALLAVAVTIFPSLSVTTYSPASRHFHVERCCTVLTIAKRVTHTPARWIRFAMRERECGDSRPQVGQYIIWPVALHGSHDLKMVADDGDEACGRNGFLRRSFVRPGSRSMIGTLPAPPQMGQARSVACWWQVGQVVRPAAGSRGERSE